MSKGGALELFATEGKVFKLKNSLMSDPMSPFSKSVKAPCLISPFKGQPLVTLHAIWLGNSLPMLSRKIPFWSKYWFVKILLAAYIVQGFEVTKSIAS